MNQKHAYTRAAGSQSEIPHWERLPYSALKISGYQNYTLSKNGFDRVSDIHKLKYQIIRPYLRMHSKDETLADIGCSAGVIGLYALLDGYTNVTFIDHDWEYIDLVKSCLSFIGAKRAKTVVSSLKDIVSCYKIGFAFAIIHWIYSYSEEMGSLEKVIKLLKGIANESIFIEWVSPNDNAIKLANHIKQNIEIIEAPYNKKYFLKALCKHYNYVKKVSKVSRTREIWYASERRERPAYKDLMISKAIISYIKIKIYIGKLLSGYYYKRIKDII